MRIAQQALHRHEKAYHGARARRAETRAENAAARDEERVEENVQHAHYRVQNAWRDHISGALQERGAQRVELRKRHHERKRQEIRARVSADRLIAVKPARERLADKRGERGKDHRDQHSGRKAVPHNGARAAVVPAADAVRRLHGKARRNAADDAADQPRARRYKTDGRRGVRAERADHCGVDVLHGDRRYLCKYRRKAQSPDLAGLRLQLRHRFSFHIIIRSAPFLLTGRFFLVKYKNTNLSSFREHAQ